MHDTQMPAKVGARDSPIQVLIETLLERYRPVATGEVASYIPELATADPDRLGIAIATADGFIYEAGDSRAAFTIQSISKPIVYGLALQCHGREAVLAKIGVEPSGEAFNSVAFDEKRNRPFNAMVNAGAIAAAALVPGRGIDERFARVRETFRAFIGREVEIDEAVYRSEAATGHRNRAIAYLELNAGMIAGDPQEHLDIYFRQCAISVNAIDLAVMGATLANGGVNPRTGERAIAAKNVRDVLSVMTSCGMYDYAGEWELRVGLPAKSGVGGGIMAVLPGQLGIGVFSPRLDEHGNSVRGLRVCEELSRTLELHLLHHRGGTRTALRRHYNGAEIPSRRLRHPESRRRLGALGARIAVYELQGDLFFGNVERVVRHVLADNDADRLVFDVGRIVTADAVAASLLRGLYESLVASGARVLFAGASGGFRDSMALDDAMHVEDVDRALEVFEDDILSEATSQVPEPSGPVKLPDFPLLSGFDPDEIDVLESHVERHAYAAGETIIRDGAPADALYFIEEGSVEIRVAGRMEDGFVRLGTVDAGNIVGEMALLGGGARTAEAVADTRASLLALTADSFATLGRAHPPIQSKLLAAIGRSLAARLRRANTEIGALAR